VSAPIKLSDLFKYYKHGLPHQMAAVKMLEEKLMAVAPELMDRSQEWYKLWTQDGKQEPNGILLNVPYQAQLDNTSGQGQRECFSSSAAMVAMYYGKVKNDDEYNRIRARFGDTTDASAQVKTLNSLGLNASFTQRCSAKMLEEELLAKRPVLTGFLHHGPVSSPRGGGHWTCCIGFDQSAFVMNDPFGEADMLNGGYLNHSKGKGVRYSRKNWQPRWEVEGPGTGWAVLIKP
jgi:hypothetical protein